MLITNPSVRDLDLKLLPTEKQIKVLQTKGGSIREEKQSHTSRVAGHFILRQVEVIFCYMYLSKVNALL